MITSALAVLWLAAGASGPGPLFPVMQGGKWGYIDRSGTVVIPPRFDAASRFSEGLASVRLGDTLAYVDAKGETVLVPAFETAGSPLHRRFSGGLAAMQQGRRIGFVDRSGKLVIPPAYLTAEDFSEGLALVCHEKGCGYVDASGGLRDSSMWMGGTSFHDGVAAVYLAMGMNRKRVQLITRAGGIVPGEFVDCGAFAEGLAPVRVGERWGYIDVKGDPVIRPRFAEARPFSQGLAAVRIWETDRCGYVDRTGALVVPPRFASCHAFSDGLARVDLSERPEDGEKLAFIDRTGRVVFSGASTQPPFAGAGDFVDGLVAVGVGGVPDEVGPGGPRLGYLDTAGRWVWRPTH